MPRIPTHQFEDEWDDPTEQVIEEDDPTDRHGRKAPREDRRALEEQRERFSPWRKRPKTE